MTSWKNTLTRETPGLQHYGLKEQLSVAAVVPAFNEADGIENVLSVLQQIDILKEIIIVDDGSQDDTLSIAHRMVKANPSMRIIRHDTNKGKGQALFTGWRASHAACLLFIDADLINLTPAHVLNLINPVRENQVQMTYGLFRGGHWDTDFSHFVIPWLTGQRCLRRELLEEIPEAAAQGYGFETALTLAAQKHKWISQGIRLQGVSHPVKERHRGLWYGLQNRAAMWSDIYHAWQLSKDPPEKRRGLSIGIRLLVFIFILMMGFSMLYNLSSASYSQHTENAPITYILNHQP